MLDLDAIRARLAAIPEWTIRPRHVDTWRRVEAGEDALAIAREEVASGRDGWLGWELVPELDEAGRGFTPTQAVQLVDMRADLAALLAEVTQLRAEAEDLRRVTAERDELAATLANERGDGPPPSEGWRRNDFKPPSVAWHRTIDRGDDFEPPHGSRVLWAYRDPGATDWTWEVERYDAHGDDYHHEARGSAPTARAAMQAADRAGGSPE